VAHRNIHLGNFIVEEGVSKFDSAHV
jgi:hypothetical protein